MAAGRNDLVSKLKSVWDNHLALRNRVHLILCGSVSSFLVRKVVQSRALYGRVDDVLNLAPLTLPETREGFFRGRSFPEALEGYLALGGIPQYLEMLDPALSLRLNLQQLCFRKGGFLVEEFDRIFVSHFGRVPYYRRIVEFLAGARCATREDIARRIGAHPGGRLSAYLDELAAAGFVETYAPVGRPPSSRLHRCRLSDPYLRFYFRFIAPRRARLASRAGALALHEALPERAYDAWRGLAFEDLCRRHAALIADHLRFSAVAYESGSWFRRGLAGGGVQVDLLFLRADRVATLCEVRFRERVGREVIPEVERKAQALARPGWTVEKVLLTVTPPSPDLLREGYFSRIVLAEELFAGGRAGRQ
jgi:hypothetical protein